jgi:hypothetical protein
VVWCIDAPRAQDTLRAVGSSHPASASPSRINSNQIREGDGAAHQVGSPRDSIAQKAQTKPLAEISAEVEKTARGTAKTDGEPDSKGKKFRYECRSSGMVKDASGPFKDAGGARDWVLSRESLEAIENAGYDVEWSV